LARFERPSSSAAPGAFHELRGQPKQAQRLGMMNFPELPSAPSDQPVPFTGQLRLAAGAYLARFQGFTRYHTESDLRCYLAWCAQRGLDPLAARRSRSPDRRYLAGLSPVPAASRCTD
jgi:hypothetical protein